MRGRRLGLFLVFGAALPLVLASTAWACGILATLTLNTQVAAPGQMVTVSGHNYNSSTSAGPVIIHLGSRNGSQVASLTPDSGGNINASLQLPASLNPGWYVAIATQYRTDATSGATIPVAGTPGRTTLRVQGAVASMRHRAAAFSPWGSVNPSGPAGSTAPAAHAAGSSGPPLFPLAVALLLSLTMLATGVTLLGRNARRPQLGL